MLIAIIFLALFIEKAFAFPHGLQMTQLTYQAGKWPILYVGGQTRQNVTPYDRNYGYGFQMCNANYRFYQIYICKVNSLRSSLGCLREFIREDNLRFNSVFKHDFHFTITDLTRSEIEYIQNGIFDVCIVDGTKVMRGRLYKHCSLRTCIKMPRKCWRVRMDFAKKIYDSKRKLDYKRQQWEQGVSNKFNNKIKGLQMKNNELKLNIQKNKEILSYLENELKEIKEKHEQVKNEALEQLSKLYKTEDEEQIANQKMDVVRENNKLIERKEAEKNSIDTNIYSGKMDLKSSDKEMSEMEKRRLAMLAELAKMDSKVNESTNVDLMDSTKEINVASPNVQMQNIKVVGGNLHVNTGGNMRKKRAIEEDIEKLLDEKMLDKQQFLIKLSSLDLLSTGQVSYDEYEEKLAETLGVRKEEIKSLEVHDIKKKVEHNGGKEFFKIIGVNLQKEKMAKIRENFEFYANDVFPFLKQFDEECSAVEQSINESLAIEKEMKIKDSEDYEAKCESMLQELLETDIEEEKKFLHKTNEKEVEDKRNHEEKIKTAIKKMGDKASYQAVATAKERFFKSLEIGKELILTKMPKILNGAKKIGKNVVSGHLKSYGVGNGAMDYSPEGEYKERSKHDHRRTKSF